MSGAVGTPTALLYTRVSSDEQEREGLSLDAQIAGCRTYAAGRGWRLGSEFQDVMSGKRDDRPNYQALLAEVRRLRAEGRAVVVVVAALDRFGRRLLERVRCREELKALGVALHSIREGGEVSDLVSNILASVAQEESDRLGVRISEIRQHTASSGWWFPGRPAWGYLLRAATDEERGAGAPMKVLALDPATSVYAAEAWQRLARGASLRSVVRWVASLPSPARGGRAMTLYAVQRMFRAPVYAARPGGPGDDALGRPRGKWPALVDDETWRRVQERTAEHRRRPHQASGEYLLTGFLRCPKCGTRMHGQVQRHHDGYVRRRYTCQTYARGAESPVPGCRVTVRVESVDAAVLAEVGPLLEALDRTEPGLPEALERAWDRLRRPERLADAARARQRLERERDRAAKLLGDAAAQLVAREIDRRTYDAAVARFDADLRAAEAALAELGGPDPEPALPPVAEALAEVGGWRRALAGADGEKRRDALAGLAERVVPVRVRYGVYTAEITWTRLGEALRAAAAALTDGDDQAAERAA